MYNTSGNSQRKAELKKLRYANAMAKAKEMQKEDLEKKYAQHASNARIDLQGGNPNLPFAQEGAGGAWAPRPIDSNWDSIAANPKNQWINTFNKAHDFSYDPKMLDPRYAAWTGARHGSTVYQGDVNNDGYDDIIEVDEQTGKSISIQRIMINPDKIIGL